MNIFSIFQRDWPYDKEYLDLERMNPKMNEREIMDCIVNDKVNPQLFVKITFLASINQFKKRL